MILISLTLDYYPVLSKEITFLSRTGFKNAIIKEKENLTALLYTKRSDYT
ncbi:MAG: hypothetical protein ACTHKJ_05400 [Candidatus Nitrosocosmicus sp.]